MKQLNELYTSRPFKVRNADEYELIYILDLFVDPTDGLTTPFEYENSIIKGRMGSGKTMYLRANHAFYLFSFVASLLNGDELILPIYIRLSDFQMIKDSTTIYDKIIMKILETMLEVCDSLKSASELERLHKGYSALTIMYPDYEKSLGEMATKLSLLSAKEYVESVSKELKSEGGVAGKFLNICNSYGNKKMTEIKYTKNLEFDEIVEAYDILLEPFNGKLLIMFDEVDSLNKSFFREDNNVSPFESLMNQLRTLPFIHTKIAIYPNSPADILTETRYGDIIELEADVFSSDYEIFLNKTLALIEKYLKRAVDQEIRVEELFDITKDNVRVLEQVIYASGGNMRRLVHLLDMAMNNAYKSNRGQDKVKEKDVIVTLKEQARKIESLFSYSEIELLSDIAQVCKARATYRFTFPNRSVSLTKFTNKSEEYNVVNLVEIGSGRKSTTFEFDYAYCVYKDIPTHYIRGSERIDKTRSREEGEKIRKVTRITDALIEQAVIPGKIEGIIKYLNADHTNGFVETEDGKSYFITKEWIIGDDQNKRMITGNKVRFVPVRYGESDYAREAELL